MLASQSRTLKTRMIA